MAPSTARKSRPEPLRLVPRPAVQAPPPEFVGSSLATRRLLGLADRLARTDLPVLITGESGVGKEVLFRRIHSQSERAAGPCVAENCAAIPEELFESEFFGHVRGAFTGAEDDHEGAFRRADGGTLFLDEIGEMPLDQQAKLLRVLEQGAVRPVGGYEEIPVDVRVVCATNRDLQALVSDGKFREDLYYRLHGATLAIPPLRSRPADIGDLASHFLKGMNAERDTDKRLDDSLLTRFLSYAWPGNARELRNVLARLYHLQDGDRLRDVGCEFAPRRAAPSGRRLVTAVAPMAEIEREAIQLALEEAGGDRRECARLLGMSRSTVYVKIKQYAL